MEFRVLGPLTVVDDAGPVVLSGVKQRAVLGFLLLHANQVVATSTLLGALWTDPPPPTARKMLQNAVSGLRGLLSGDDSLLLTHAPGYLLRVRPADLDLTTYRSKVDVGRAELADGSWSAAAETLRTALDLWRGPVLADLTESGLDWPEPAALEQGRRTALEDLFEAELARGRHLEVVERLSELVETEPVRERLCAELLLALYRCGRQVDALDCYRRTRDAFAEQLGLDPGRLLRELERAILDHDPVLERPDALRVLAGQERPVVTAVSGPPAFSPGRPPKRPGPKLPPLTPCRAPGGLTEQRKQLSTLLVRTGSGIDADRDPEAAARLAGGLSATIREEIERFGGKVSGMLGPVTFAIFGVPRTREDDAARAVRAGLSLRDRLGAGDPGVRVAVATGEVFVACAADGSGSVPVVGGAVPDSCAGLLETVPPGGIRVCDATRASSERSVRYRDHDGGREPVAMRAPGAAAGPSLVDRERELTRFGDLLDDVVRRQRPHLLTLLGEPGAGKTRLADELTRLAAARDFTVLSGHAGSLHRDTPYGPVAELVATAAGVADTDSAAATGQKLARAVERTGDPAAWLVTRLRALLDGEPVTDRADAFEAWRGYLAGLTAERPLLVVLEDLHDADELLVDFAAYLAGSGGPVPLLLAVTARPELLDAHPDWGGGHRDSATWTLDPLTRAGTARLFGELRGAAGGDVLDRIGGNPLFAVEYARAGETGLPPHVRRVVAARLDTLAPEAKAALVGASVLGPAFAADAVAAVCGIAEPAAAKLLDHLERREFLRRSRRALPGRADYAFRHPVTREVAWSTISRAARAEREQRAAAWRRDEEDLAV